VVEGLRSGSPSVSGLELDREPDPEPEPERESALGRDPEAEREPDRRDFGGASDEDSAGCLERRLDDGRRSGGAARRCGVSQ
jgi:hypothetical protein